MNNDNQRDEVLPEAPATLPLVPFWADEKQVISQDDAQDADVEDAFGGCADAMLTAIAEHEDWQEGYDY